MAQLISVKLSRFDGSPWGFRLQGGKDFGTPLVVQKVNGGSPADAAGLRAGDAVIRVNNTDMFNLRHKDAQDVIVRAGNSFELTVQRGGSTWKPSVSPVSASIPSPQPSIPVSNISPVTKTSLAAKKQDVPHIGSGQNFSPKPFLNGTGDGSIKSIVNKQYNSPVGMYSEETIAETLSAQAEVLAGGVLGVNFKKNEKNYNAENSEVFKMVQEADKEPKTPEPVEPIVHSGVVTPSSPALAGLRSVSAPETKPQPSAGQTSLPPGQNICAECERLIVGVFVRIKEKNLHVECFKCSTCGTSLKNVGYYNINNKLYCDIHAKMVARQNAPTGLAPVTVPPGGKAPAGTISAALANAGISAPLSPPLSHGSSPQPFSSYHHRPDRGFNHYRDSSLNSQYINNNDHRNGMSCENSKVFTSTLTVQTGGAEVGKLPTNARDESDYTNLITPLSNNLIGPKPFSGTTPTSNFSSPPPTINSGSNVRPQSQTVTDSYENYECYEIIEDTRQDRGRSTSRSTSRCKNRVWPPEKPIEDITYPTASPLYINPNPVLDKRHSRQIERARAIAESNLRHRREEMQSMESVSCPGPMYRSVELVSTSEDRPCRSSSRASSAEGTRRSLTPTRITQPTPKPWTATVTSGHYERVQAPLPPPPPPVCKKICHREVHERREEYRGGSMERETSLYREEEYSTEPESRVHYIPIQTEKEPDITEDLSKIVPPDVAVCPKGVQGGHEFFTETTENEEGNLHVKKTTTYEKTVEVLSPDRAASPARDDTTEIEEIRETRSEILDREVEDLSDRRETSESAGRISSVIETQKLLESTKTGGQSAQVERVEFGRQEDGRKRRVSFGEQRETTRENLAKEEDMHVISQQKKIAERVSKEDTGKTEKTTKEKFQELTEEIYIQECGRKQDVEDQRRKSLREQVEVHQSLREQQAPEKRQTLQERRLCSRYGRTTPDQKFEERGTHEKHVQFAKQTEVQQLPPPIVKNSVPKEWKSEMCKALTTAPARSYSPLDSSSSSKKVYSEEYVYEEVRSGPPPPVSLPPAAPQERPVSPFQEALTTAPERPYTPLGREVEPVPTHCRYVRESEVCQQGYYPPAEILYNERKVVQERKPPAGPRPLPTPPPDFRFRDSSKSPSRSRPQTPSRFMTGLKKPDTIPSYQRNLVATVKNPVESHTYVPSRTPTPTPGRCKSPAQGPPEPPACYVRAPRIREDTPPCRRSYDPPSDHRRIITDDSCVEDSRDERGNLVHVEKKKHIVEEFDTTSTFNYAPPVTETVCAIKKESHAMQPSLPCPLSRSGSCASACQETCHETTSELRDVKRVEHIIYPPQPPKCPETGVRVLPCKAHSSVGSKAGVVIVPCDGPQSNCSRSGVCVQPTADRSGLCVSPCFGGPKASGHSCPSSGGCESSSGCYNPPSGRCTPSSTGCVRSENCYKSSEYCSLSSGGCERSSGCYSKSFECTTQGGCSPDRSSGCCPSSGCDDPRSGICVTPCADGSGVCVAPCVPSASNIPFPQIPLPNATNQCGFEPIHKPRSNLSNQLTRLTVKPEQPKVRLYKPEAQSQCPAARNTQRLVDPPNLSSHPDLGSGISGLGSKSGSFAGSTAPKRGRGILNQAGGPGARLPLCAHCNSYVRGPFITALGQIWCPEHFVCVNAQCRRALQDIGFVEEKGQLYCEYCFERFIAPSCNKCNNKIKGDCLNAIGKHFHPECFNCSYCGKLFGNSPFFLEEGLPYCEADWNELFTTKCFACGFPVEAGDRWVEALNNNYHSQCFNCTMCKKNLEGQSFYAKGGRPFCKNHAR